MFKRGLGIFICLFIIAGFLTIAAAPSTSTSAAVSATTTTVIQNSSGLKLEIYAKEGVMKINGLSMGDDYTDASLAYTGLEDMEIMVTSGNMTFNLSVPSAKGVGVKTRVKQLDTTLSLPILPIKISVHSSDGNFYLGSLTLPSTISHLGSRLINFIARLGFLPELRAENIYAEVIKVSSFYFSPSGAVIDLEASQTKDILDELKELGIVVSAEGAVEGTIIEVEG